MQKVSGMFGGEVQRMCQLFESPEQAILCYEEMCDSSRSKVPMF